MKRHERIMGQRSQRTHSFVSAALLAGCLVAFPGLTVGADAAKRPPLTFEANQGQTDERVRFLARGPGYRLFLTSTEAVLALRDGNVGGPKRGVLTMRLMGANPASKIEGIERAPGRVNYLIGGDAAKWRHNIPTYRRVAYRDIYPGIDLIYYGTQTNLEYDFFVAPGAEPKMIRFALAGARDLAIDGQGDLVLQMPGGETRLHKPVAYQEIEGCKRSVPIRYSVDSSKNPEIRFEIAAYDIQKPLIIDPTLVYSTYLGGSADDFGYGIAIDASGSAYVTGSTESLNFPTAGNPLQPALSDLTDAFVTKFTPDGSDLVYSTYLGGSGNDAGWGIAVDAAGNAVVTGNTTSSNFPRKNPLQSTYGGGFFGDAFVSKLNADGSDFVYSTYLGGSESDWGYGIALDSDGNAYVTGYTASSNFPTRNPYQPLLGGGSDAFLSKINADGSQFVYSTYLGGSDDDIGRGIAVRNGSAYLTGYTESSDFPRANALQPNLGGRKDAFVTVFNGSGSALVYSTYLGGSNDDFGYGIAVDADGKATVAGATDSRDFPTFNPLQPAHGDCPLRPCNTGFVSKLNAGGSAFEFSTYLGGTNIDVGYGIGIDAARNIYVTGSTRSGNFPTVNALQPEFGGDTDAFVAKLNPGGSALTYSTFLGGSSNDQGRGIAVDADGNAYVAGFTRSSNFPTAAPFQPESGGGADAFVAKIAGDP